MQTLSISASHPPSLAKGAAPPSGEAAPDLDFTALLQREASETLAAAKAGRPSGPGDGAERPGETPAHLSSPPAERVLVHRPVEAPPTGMSPPGTAPAEPPGLDAAPPTPIDEAPGEEPIAGLPDRLDLPPAPSSAAGVAPAAHGGWSPAPAMPEGEHAPPASHQDLAPTPPPTVLPDGVPPMPLPVVPETLRAVMPSPEGEDAPPASHQDLAPIPPPTVLPEGVPPMPLPVVPETLRAVMPSPEGEDAPPASHQDLAPIPPPAALPEGVPPMPLPVVPQALRAAMPAPEGEGAPPAGQSDIEPIIPPGETPEAAPPMPLPVVDLRAAGALQLQPALQAARESRDGPSPAEAGVSAMMPGSLQDAPAIEVPRAEAPSAPPPLPPARQLAPVAIALAFSPSLGQLSLTLDPPNLGRVEIAVTREGAAHEVRVVAERPETLALLERDRGELARGLAEAGVAVAEGGLRFALSEQQAGGQDRPTPERREATRPGREAAGERISLPLAAPAAGAAARGLINLRI